MSETPGPAIAAVLETMRADMRQRDRAVDAQLNKIHDLVNSQLTEAVNRFRDALKTIEELKALLFQQGTAIPGERTDPSQTLATTHRLSPQVPPAPDTPAPDDVMLRSVMELLDATKTMALKLIEQSEKISSLILERRARIDTDQRVERRRVFP